MTELKPLVSTVQLNTPDALSKLVTDAQAASADGQVLASEIQSAAAAVLASITSDADSEALTAAEQLASVSPEIGVFVKSLQQSITDAKEGSPQGLLLSQQLQQGTITQAQFNTAVAAIVLSASQIQAAVMVNLPVQTQKLILALAGNKQINQLAKLVANSQPKVQSAEPKLDGAKDGEKAPVVPPVQGRLITKETDVKLGNTQDWLTTMIKIAAKAAAQNAKASASSLISLRPQPKIMSGARAVVKLNGTIAVLCNNVQFEVSTDWTEIRGIDELVPNDLAPTSFSVKGSMSIYRVPNQSPISQFLQQDMFGGIIWPYTSIEIRDKRTDEIIMQVRRAAITSRSEAYTKGQLTSMNLSFVGIGFRDEKMPELLPDKLTGSEEDGVGGLLDNFKSVTNMIKKLF